MKKKLLMFMMIGVFSFSALSFTGCGDDSGSSSSDTAATEEAEDAGDTEEAEETEEAADTEETEEASNESVYDNFDTFYMGITDDENTYALVAFGNNGSFGMIEFFDAESKESGSWVGEVTTEGDTMTIADEQNGTTFTFDISEVDGGYKLDMGDLGTALVESAERDEFVEAAENVDAGTQPQF